MSFSAQYYLSEVLPLAEAAYDPSLLPKDWTNLGEIACVPQQYGLSYFGLFAQNGDTTALLLPGTVDEQEWCADAEFLQEPNPFGPGRVHSGAMGVYRALYIVPHKRTIICDRAQLENTSRLCIYKYLDIIWANNSTGNGPGYADKQHHIFCYCNR